MKYGVAIFPSKEIQDVANSYRMRYDPHYALIPPHITLKESFEIKDNEELDAVLAELKRVAENTKPFPIEVNKVSSFSPVTKTIYLKVEPVTELINLNERLHQGKLESEQSFAFVPHITIGQKMSDDEFSDVFGSLKIQEFNMEETADRFQLMYQLENGAWTVYETFRFSN
ncbi:YjcG family protein [Aquibacillus kalidii]|uniref:YjcG family protein n=1 Tax=Aquibacillus kalidii TaxID=2762597 RepID=UPI001646938C|nr:YjcG family protein [Aquibacillus kalidii]